MHDRPDIDPKTIADALSRARDQESFLNVLLAGKSPRSRS
jgi:hypothetical protein